jgi:hypothetical protein
MEAKPAPSEEPSDARLRDATGAPERFGPLELERLIKDDGRALIVYARAEEAGPGEHDERQP